MAADVETVPEFYKKLADNPRVTVRRKGAPLKDGKCVAYWMQRAERGIDNPAVDLAI
jgi:deoxyribodipyrimidine photo-lyase